MELRWDAPTDITITLRMLARLTGITVLTGLSAACLSAPAHGMAGDEAVGEAGVAVITAAPVGAVTGVDTVMDTDSLADAVTRQVVAMPDADMLAVATVAERFEAEAASMAIAAEGDFTVAVVAGSTAVVADTGKA
jgi:hypothetical protein